MHEKTGGYGRREKFTQDASGPCYWVLLGSSPVEVMSTACAICSG